MTILYRIASRPAYLVMAFIVLIASIFFTIWLLLPGDYLGFFSSRKLHYCVTAITTKAMGMTIITVTIRKRLVVVVG